MFDAWKNDFTKDPLLAFISEFDAGLAGYFSGIPFLKKHGDNAGTVLREYWKPALKVIGFALLKHAAGIGADQVNSLFEEDGDSDEIQSDEKTPYKDVQKQLSNELNKVLNRHRSVKEAIRDFKGKLSRLITELNKLPGFQLPLIIYIDELDRCRPDYAIELLEGIKHLFGVPGVYFVIAINITQLSHSIRAVYGSGFDGYAYLKRFFDMQYSLRQPSNKQFTDSLVETIGVSNDSEIVFGLNHVEIPGYGILNSNKEFISFVLEKHADAFNLALRDQGQVAHIVEAALICLKNERIHIFFLVFLAVVYHQDPIVFKKICDAKNLSLVTGFKERFEMNSTFVVPYPYRGESIRHTTVQEVALKYFESLSMEQSDVRRVVESPTRFTFPENLLFSGLVSHNIHDITKEYSNYFALIRDASGFGAIGTKNIDT